MSYSLEDFELLTSARRLGRSKVKELLQIMKNNNIAVEVLLNYLKSIEYKVPSSLEGKMRDLERRISVLEGKPDETDKLLEPSEESKQVGGEKKYVERYILRKEFWTQLLEKAKEKTDLHSNISPGKYSWVAATAGKRGVIYSYVITNKYAGVEIYLDKGKKFEDPNINKIRFDQLYEHKEEIERDFGGRLNWERLDDKRACRISLKFDRVGLRDENKWDKLQNKMIDAMMRLDEAFGKYIKQLK